MAAKKVKVVIAVDRDAKKIGRTVEVDPATAQAWVSEGRAAYKDRRDAPTKRKVPGHGQVDATPVDATDRTGSQAGASASASASK